MAENFPFRFGNERIAVFSPHEQRPWQGRQIECPVVWQSQALKGHQRQFIRLPSMRPVPILPRPSTKARSL
ncbi:MAG: hypothetical protein CM15mP21_4330 [Hyphomicrobiales bacterium]|nr:MAG: hypothetical protein CM15mP21_4330 [Hyphomicrobiales bacterium]